MMHNRMEDHDLSLFETLKNKVNYRIRQAVSDPEANRYAADKDKHAADKHAQEKAATASPPATIQEPMEDAEEPDDPNAEVTFQGVAKKAWRTMKRIVQEGFFPFIAFLVAIYVANEMIVYPAPVRFGFFVFALVICIMFRHAAIGMGIYYLCKMGYDYYVNHLGDPAKKHRVMPYVFAWLPIMTYEPESVLTRLVTWPFRYPKTEEDATELPRIMREYQDQLNGSFPYLDELKTTDFMVENLKKLAAQWESMHTKTYPSSSETTAAPLPPTVSTVANVPKEGTVNELKNMAASST